MKIRIATWFILILLFPAFVQAGSADISIDASKVIRTLPDALFGQNVNVYDKTADGLDTAYDQAVIDMGASLMRFPGGGYAEFTDWQNYASCKLSWLPIDMAKGIAFAKATHTRLQIIVNASGKWCDTDHDLDTAVKKAADWVLYMNVNPAADPTLYWEFGNENFGKDDKTKQYIMSGTEYGQRFVKFATAMKKVDPRIKIGLQVQPDKDKMDWSSDILKAVKKGGIMPDFFIIHSYPVWLPDDDRTADKAPSWDKTLYAGNPTLDNRILTNAETEPVNLTDLLDKLVSDNLGPSYVGKIPYWMTEYRSVLAYKYDEFVDTLYCAQFLLELGRLGWGGANIWDIKNGYNAKNQDDFGLLRTGSDASIADDNPADSPHPTYYIFPYLSRVFGKQLVQCSTPPYASMDSPGNKVRAWASKDKQGNLTVFLVNNDPDNPANANLKISGFNAASSGLSWTLESYGKTASGDDTPILQRHDITINGTIRPSVASLPGPGTPMTTGNSFNVSLPKASIVLVKIPAVAQ